MPNHIHDQILSVVKNVQAHHYLTVQALVQALDVQVLSLSNSKLDGPEGRSHPLVMPKQSSTCHCRSQYVVQEVEVISLSCLDKAVLVIVEVNMWSKMSKSSPCHA